MGTYGSRRDALPGEVCTCGRQAVEVFTNPDGTEVGYCGLPDGGDKSGPCPFCGGDRHEYGPCPQYTVRPMGTAWDRHDDPEQQPDQADQPDDQAENRPDEA